MNEWMFGNLAPGSLLAQVRPAVTTAVTAWTPTLRTEITAIKVCNTSGATRTFRLYHDDDGGTFSEETALYWDIPVLANETAEINADSINGGITVAKNGRVGVRSDQTSGLTFTFYGTVQAVWA